MERRKIIKDIGKLQGRILVFGGVYSNFQALEKMYAIAKDLDIPPENIICTGDVVAYCAQPETCVEKIMDWGIHVIAGNVEIQLREGGEDCGCQFKSGGRCDIFSKQWLPFAQQKLSRNSIEWMQTLPDFIRFGYADKKGMVVHGSFHETAAYIFESTPWEIKEKNFIDSDSDLIISGHCGLVFNQEKNNKYWLNPGVIGMPANDGTTRVWHMLLDEKENGFSFQHHSFEYDFEKAAQLMEMENLPSTYARTLQTGIWDNCETLPEVETHLQGKPLEF